MGSHEVTFAGVRLCERYGMVLSDFRETPAKPKVLLIDIPYGPTIDITDNLGTVSFGPAKHELSFFVRRPASGTVQDVLSAVKTLLSGMRGSYSLSWDPERTYTGRFVVTEAQSDPNGCGKVKVEVTVDAFSTRAFTEVVDCCPTATLRVVNDGARASVPRVRVTRNTVTVTRGSASQTAQAGTTPLSSLQVQRGSNTFGFTASDWVARAEGESLALNGSHVTRSGETLACAADAYSVTGESLVPDAARQLVQFTWTTEGAV